MAALANPINADALRLRHEFTDLPGLRLTIAQVARLLGISVARATDVVQALMQDGFLESDDAMCPIQYGRPAFMHEQDTTEECPF